MKNLLFLSTFIFTSFVFAQQQCHNLFFDASIVHNSYKKLNNETVNFLDYLKKDKGNHSVIDIDVRLKSLGLHYEKYFTTANIDYKKQSQNLNISEFVNEKSEKSILYDTYEIHGSRYGDELSRLINGIQVNKKHLNSTPPRIIFDPMYELNHKDTYGHFNVNSGTIFFGLEALTHARTGIGAIIRHEIHHYIEQTKIDDGQVTLARFTFHKTSPTRKVPYAGFLRLDEVETHLREIRTLSQISDKHDQKLLDLGTPVESMEAIKKAYRPAVIKEKIEWVKRFITDSRLELSNIKQVLSTGQNWSTMIIDETKKKFQVVFFISDGKYGPANYDTVIINMYKLINDSDLKKTDVILEKIQELISWSENRLNSVEKEITRLEKKNEKPSSSEKEKAG